MKRTHPGSCTGTCEPTQPQHAEVCARSTGEATDGCPAECRLTGGLLLLEGRAEYADIQGSADDTWSPVEDVEPTVDSTHHTWQEEVQSVNAAMRLQQSVEHRALAHNDEDDSGSTEEYACTVFDLMQGLPTYPGFSS